jgi:hypothetical protein
MPTLVCGVYSTYTIHKCNHVLKTHVLLKQESVPAVIIYISAEIALIVFKLRGMGWGYDLAYRMAIYQETQHRGGDDQG